MAIFIPMEQKEIVEAGRAGIPTQIVAKMSRGYKLNEKEKEIVHSKGKVYVEAHKKDGRWVKPQLRALPGFRYRKKEEIKSRNVKSKEDIWSEMRKDIERAHYTWYTMQDLDQAERWAVHFGGLVSSLKPEGYSEFEREYPTHMKMYKEVLKAIEVQR